MRLVTGSVIAQREDLVDVRSSTGTIGLCRAAVAIVDHVPSGVAHSAEFLENPRCVAVSLPLIQYPEEEW